MIKGLSNWRFFFLIAFLLQAIGGCESNSKQKDIQLQRGPGALPQLVFACELDTDKLRTLFSKPDVIRDLKDLHAGVSLALQDYSPGRAQMVQELNQAGVPVIAWLALPPAKGYYFNADNASEAV